MSSRINSGWKLHNPIRIGFLRCFVICFLCFLAFSGISQDENGPYQFENNFDENVGKALDFAREGKITKSTEAFVDLLHKAELSLGKDHEKVATAYHKWGVAYYLNDLFEEAIEKFKKAKEIRKKLFGATHPDVARGLLNIGVNYKYLGNYKLSSQYVLDAIELYSRLEDTEQLAFSYMELGIIYDLKGDFDQALDYYQIALTSVETLFGEEDYDSGQINWMIGNLYEQKEEADLAEHYLLKSNRIFEAIGELEGQALNYNILGSLEHRLRGNFPKALNYYFKCLKIFKSLEYPPAEAIGDIHNNLGIVYKKMADYEKALMHLDSSLVSRLDVFGANHSRVAHSYDNIANVYEQKKEFNTALKYYQKAINVLIPEIVSEETYENPHISFLKNLDLKPLMLSIISDKANTLLKKAGSSSGIEDYGMAMDAFYTADSLINIMRRDYNAEGSKLFWIKKTRTLYENAIQACFQLKLLTDDKDFVESAFFFAEKSKAVLLLEGFRETEAKGFANIPAEKLETDKKFKNEIIRLEELSLKYNDITNKDDLASVRDSLVNTKNTYDRFIKELERDFPKFYNLKYETGVASVKDIQNSIDRNSAYLQYFIGTSQDYVFGISKRDINFIALEKSEHLVRNVKDLREALTDKKLFETSSKKTFDLFRNASYQIYQEFLRDVLTEIGQNKSRLIIIPDGILNFVPFETLLVEDFSPDQPDYFNAPFLLNNHTISYSYSGTLLLENSKRSQSGSFINQLISFAPDYKNSKELPPLPGAKKEVEKISGLYKNQEAFYGNSATKAQFKKSIVGSGIIHLAMHGFVDLENESLSNLAFSQDIKNTGKANHLYAYEIPSLDLNAHLVVLSACETGIGKNIGGEGVMSLARSFMYAGTPSIVMSLWQTNDLATQQIMTDFHTELLKGKDKDQAIRIAKLNYIKSPVDETAHPFYWAPFVSIGDYHPIPKKGSKPWLYWLLGITIIFLSGYYLNRVTSPL